MRAHLAEDVRLDLVGRHQRAGRRDVGTYFTNYAAAKDWHLVPAWLDGREVFAVVRRSRLRRAFPLTSSELTFVERQDLRRSSDYRYAPYVALEAPIRIVSG